MVARLDDRTHEIIEEHGIMSTSTDKRLEVLENAMGVLEQQRREAQKKLNRWRMGTTGALLGVLLAWPGIGVAKPPPGPDLGDRVQALEDLLINFSIVTHDDQNHSDIYITGANLHIRNGEGSTRSTNSYGNVIVGYNAEPRNQGGSHNLVIGDGHEYRSYGGFVAGYFNTIGGESASVSGGSHNAANGENSSVSGGFGNAADGDYASVSGGQGNLASGDLSSVSGGYLGYTLGDLSWIGGGAYGTTVAAYSSVSGGQYGAATGQYSSVSGGRYTTAAGEYSSVSGGEYTTAGGESSSVSGGTATAVYGQYDWAAGALFQEE